VPVSFAMLRHLQSDTEIANKNTNNSCQTQPQRVSLLSGDDAQHLSVPLLVTGHSLLGAEDPAMVQDNCRFQAEETVWSAF